MDYNILNLGDQAITIEFGSTISEHINSRVLDLHTHLKEAIAAGQVRGIIETVPTFRSLTIHFNPLQLFPEEVEAIVKSYLSNRKTNSRAENHWQFPACYCGEYAEDLPQVAQDTALETDELVLIHSRQVFRVFMIGFLPGFPYMGTLDKRLHLPRRREPRIAVPKGSIAIANQLTAIYPSESPGGWHLIGRTPIDLFDPDGADPALLKPGDRVSFYQISKNDFEEIERAVQAKAFDLERECRLVDAIL